MVDTKDMNKIYPTPYQATVVNDYTLTVSEPEWQAATARAKDIRQHHRDDISWILAMYLAITGEREESQ